MGRAGGPTISQARPAGIWHIEDSRRTWPPRRIGEAHGANVGTAVEEVVPDWSWAKPGWPTAQSPAPCRELACSRRIKN